jgi:Mn2+/Fe2+ NRAMP family transporter
MTEKPLNAKDIEQETLMIYIAMLLVGGLSFAAIIASAAAHVRADEAHALANDSMTCHGHVAEVLEEHHERLSIAEQVVGIVPPDTEESYGGTDSE